MLIQIYMSGANDHWELGAIETYWNTWSSLVTGFMHHANLDETYWMFAANMANHIMVRLPTEGNRGFVSPIEHLTNETPRPPASYSRPILPYLRRSTQGRLSILSR
jgi:hypothetical protein